MELKLSESRENPNLFFTVLQALGYIKRRKSELWFHSTTGLLHPGCERDGISFISLRSRKVKTVHK